MENPKIIKVGNVVGGGKSQGGSVYLQQGISPSLLSGMSHGNVMPYVIEIREIENARDNRSGRHIRR